VTDKRSADESLHAKGLALLRDRKPAEAARVFKLALDGNPASAVLHNDLGRALNNQGDLAAAAAAFQKALELDDGLTDTHANLGHVLRGLQRLDEAREAYQQALRRDANHVRALQGLGILCLANQQAMEAAEFFARATEAQPDDPRAWGQLAAARQRAGDSATAEHAYRRALELDPADAETRLNHGITLQDLDCLEEAIAEYRRAAELAPDSLAIQNHLGNALLAAGHAEEAMRTTDCCLAIDPGNTAALSLRGIALVRQGHSEEAGKLVDSDKLIRQVTVEAPSGFADLAAFNTALADHVLADASLTFEPDGHATRKGGHTRDLLQGDKGPVAHLEQCVKDAAREYLAKLDLPSDHPFPGRVPSVPRLAMWAVVMETEGHQLPHIHPAAWLSGVYYVSLPSSLGCGDDGNEGWIEFGLPPDELLGGNSPEQKLFEPREGEMFLFPSYFYHRTIPFPGDERRICIAFDLLRRQQRSRG
jgi:tetratricopeptide (TPR) repeat protein